MSFAVVALILSVTARADFASNFKTKATTAARILFENAGRYPERFDNIDSLCGMSLASGRVDGAVDAVARLRAFEAKHLTGAEAGFAERRLAGRIAGLARQLEQPGPGETLETHVFSGREEIEAYFGQVEELRGRIRAVLLHPRVVKPSRYVAIGAAYGVKLAAFGAAALAIQYIGGQPEVGWASGLAIMAGAVALTDAYGVYAPAFTKNRGLQNFAGRAREYFALDPSAQRETWVAHARNYRTTRELIEATQGKDAGRVAGALGAQQILGMNGIVRVIFEWGRELGLTKLSPKFETLVALMQPGRAKIDHVLHFNEQTNQVELVVTVRTFRAAEAAAAAYEPVGSEAARSAKGKTTRSRRGRATARGGEARDTNTRTTG